MVALFDSYSVAQDTTLNVPAPGVLSNDSDPRGQSFSAALASTPSSGTLVLDPNGGFTYTPNGGFNGSDGFSYFIHENTDLAGYWKNKMLEGYKITPAKPDKYHYAVLHTFSTDNLIEVESQLNRLENAFQTFYYWWALHGPPWRCPSSARWWCCRRPAATTTCSGCAST